MDTFNVVWSTLWGDYVMAQYQQDNEIEELLVHVDSAPDFQFFLSNILQIELQGRYTDSERDTVSYALSAKQMEAVTDWINEFNQQYRKPIGLPFPDFYLDEENIRDTTVNIYSQWITDFVSYMVKNQNSGRDKIGEWALDNIFKVYSNANLQSKKAAMESGTYKQGEV
jgi:hypothetical protein